MKLKDFVETLDAIYSLRLRKDGNEICITDSDSILIPMFEDAEIVSLGTVTSAIFSIELGEKTPWFL